MAIRDVGGKAAAPPPAPTAQGTVPPALEKAMHQAGLVPPGGDPRAVLNQLLGGLKQQGFTAPAKMPAADQLRQVLVQAQRKNNLPPTGNLDAATAALLTNLGVAQPPDGKKEVAQKDGFEQKLPSIIRPEGAPKKNKADDAQQQQAPNADFVDGLLNMLGGAGAVPGEASKEVGGKAVFAAGKGVEAENAKGQAAVTAASSTKEGKETAGPTKKDVDGPVQPHGMEKGDAKGVKVARGLQAKEAKTDERQRTQTNGAHDPTARGAEEGDALEGAGDDGKKRRGQGGDHAGAQEEGAEQSASPGGAGGTEADAGNATSGAVDDDPRRGRASGDDPDEMEEGYYKVPPLSEQAWASLASIQRDAHEENRATTYTWDATFYRPDVYGPGQKAQEVLHLVVKKATAFDPVWQKSVEALTALVHRFEKDAATPTMDDVVGALRQARARDGEKQDKLPSPKLMRSMKA